MAPRLGAQRAPARRYRDAGAATSRHASGPTGVGRDDVADGTRAAHQAQRVARAYRQERGLCRSRGFPEQARKIHYGETEHRSIYGEATPEEAKELHEEGVDFHPLPVLPDEFN